MTQTAQELVIQRAIKAPRKLVYQAWTRAEHLAHWWGPDGFTTSRCEVDPRPGGAIRIEMCALDGTIYPMSGTYRELVEPERIVFLSTALDGEGRALFEVLNTVTLEETNGHTLQTLTARVVSRQSPLADEYLAGMEQGWNESLGRLGCWITASEREIVFQRVFRAGREKVFQTWVDPRHLSNWWGPRGFTTTIYEMNVRPGGVWRFIMHGPDGTDYNNHVTYTEVVRPERLCYRHGGDHKDNEFDVTVTFEEHDGGTRVTLSLVAASPEARQWMVQYGAVEGGHHTLARLAAVLDAIALKVSLPSEREIVLERLLGAPARLVFEALTRPEHVKRWYGCHASKLVGCEIDLRPGGAYRYTMEVGGREFVMKGVYREIAPPDRLVYTEIFEDYPDNEALVTVTLHEQDGKTRYVSHVLYDSRQVRDAVLASGMEHGAAETLDRLDALVAELG